MINIVKHNLKKYLTPRKIRVNLRGILNYIKELGLIEEENYGKIKESFSNYI